MAGDLACLMIVVAAVAVIAVVLFLAWMQGGDVRGGGGSDHSDLDVDPHTGVPYGAMDSEMDDGA
jgi:hypothetical protein